MTTQQMEYFLALAQKLNFSAVAERFFITQPTLSRQISNLESELNTQLFIRKNNAVSLTLAGERLYAGLKGIYGNFLELTQQVEEIGRNRAGELHIGLAEEQLFSDAVLSAIRELHQERPHVQITIRRCQYAQLRNGLLDGTLDVINGLRCLEDAFLSGMTQILCSDEPACLAVCARQAETLPAALSGMELERLLRRVPVLLPDGEGFAPPREDPVGDLEDNMDFAEPLRNVMMVRQLTSVPLYVSAGLGVAVTNRTALIATDPNIRLIPILDSPTYPKVLAYRSLEQNPLLPHFIALVEKHQKSRG